MKPITVVLGRGEVIVNTYEKSDDIVGIVLRKCGKCYEIGRVPLPSDPEYLEPGVLYPPLDDAIYIEIGNVESGIVLLEAVTRCLVDLQFTKHGMVKEIE